MKHNYLILGLFSLALAACSGGENGIDGKDGKDGGSCHVAENGDGSATITCPDGTSFTIKNGENGKKGDAGSDGEKGQNGESCKLVENSDGSVAVVCPYDGTSYIVRGNSDNYANYCAPGFYGKNCENECRECGEHGDCNDGVTGDGSCICLDGWSDEDCSVCPAGFYDGVTDCFDCRKGSAYFGSEKCKLSDTRAGETVTYNVVTIGNQTWMAENLKATKDINGNNVTCYANTDETNEGISDFVEKYGCLYVWEDGNKVCPKGWRLPTADEYLDLIGGSEYDNWYNTTAIQSTSWNSSASNSTGFGALPAGGRTQSDEFYDFGVHAFFWSATTTGGFFAYTLKVGTVDTNVGNSLLEEANSVRCVKK